MDSRTVAVVGVLLVILGTLPFVVSPTATTTAAVPFEETKPTGLPDRVVFQARESTLAIPKAQAYYSQYRYVVGYYGVTSLVSAAQTGERRELGRTLSIYVSDFSGTDVRVGEEGYLRMSELAVTGWVPARDAYFVVNSSARVPTRETAIVPFSNHSDAAAFARRYGGTVERWPTVRERSVGRTGRTVEQWQRIVEQRKDRTNRTVAAARRLLNRSVSVTVDRNASTLTRAIQQAPPNSTVVLPPGTYRVDGLRIRKPLTIRGAGPNATHIVGDRNGSVIVSTVPETAIAGVSITGVGPERSGKNDSRANVSVPEDSWRYTYYKVHGYGDAAVVFDDAGSSFVSDVRINTTSNGVIARTSPDMVVSNLTLYGTERWEDGFLGVSAVGGRAIVRDSRFYGGKVGVYVYDASGVVVRDSRMEGMMVGVFDLFGSQIMAVNNSVEDVWNGIYLETRSYGNAVVNNFLHNNVNGVIVAGKSNFIARNTMVHNRKGMQVHGQFTVYRRNVLAYNRVGAESGALLPLNRVSANDFVGNERYVATQNWNVLHVWRGNYWAGAPGLNWDGDRHLKRSFRPTGPVGRVAPAPGAPTLARSPAVVLIRQLQRIVPGLQSAGVLDTRPLARPGRPRAIERMRMRYDSAGQHEDLDIWDFVA